MCDPTIAAVAAVAAVSAVGVGASYQQGHQAQKSSKQQYKNTVVSANEQTRRVENTRQQGILQQQKDQAQIANKNSSKRKNMLAKYNISQGNSTKAAGNILGVNQLSGSTTDTLG